MEERENCVRGTFPDSISTQRVSDASKNMGVKHRSRYY